ncbi:MAG: BamA/TamA family outer membrane protein [Candidatus Palauibacterales bacterium]|nr:BamA/TamA family outer membrane protein [Candidatus Palauibacterales bacterium]
MAAAPYRTSWIFTVRPTRGWRQAAACLLLSVLLGAIGSARAQEPAAQDAEGQPPAASAADDGGSLVPLPVVFYQPETGLGFGVTAINYYRMTPGDTISPPSSLSLVGVYTTKNQLILALWSDMFLDEDRWRISSKVSYVKFPTKYWGIGNDTPDSAEEDYTPKALELKLWPQKEIGPGWYAGASANVIDRKVAEASDGGLIDTGQAPGVDDDQSLGFGASLIRDSRDNRVFPRRGSYHKLLVDLYAKVWFGDNGFGVYTLDLRRYFPVGGTHVLAFQVLGIATSGEPPFDLYPQLGGDSLLRGYYQGRYRDRDLIALQGEYRLPLFWRIGAAGFASAGQVAPDVGSFGLDRFWLAGGAGLRFLLAEREGLNVRADFALGENSNGFYLSIGETF